MTTLMLIYVVYIKISSKEWGYTIKPAKYDITIQDLHGIHKCLTSDRLNEYLRGTKTLNIV